jgi:hypothetical protein
MDIAISGLTRPQAHTVAISRTYLGYAGSTRVLSVASPDASWTALLGRLTAAGLAAASWTGADSTDGVTVTGLDLRTARRVHDLAGRTITPGGSS